MYFSSFRQLFWFLLTETPFWLKVQNWLLVLLIGYLSYDLIYTIYSSSKGRMVYTVFSYSGIGPNGGDFIAFAIMYFYPNAYFLTYAEAMNLVFPVEVWQLGLFDQFSMNFFGIFLAVVTVCGFICSLPYRSR